MELILKGFDDWAIDTAHSSKGKRWVDVCRKKGKDPFGKDGWICVENFTDLNEALDYLIEEGLQMTEDQVCEAQETCY